MKSPFETVTPGSVKAGGFSLLELLMVLLILGIFAAVSAPAISRLLNTITVRDRTQGIVSTLRYARLKSISTGQKVRVVLNTADGPVFQLSGGVKEDRIINLNEEDSLTMEPAEITFYPESQASAAELTLVIGNQRRDITVDPLTALPIIN
jgi:prepilin-type N-terminal cleavage/methylation domain-containing protein